jgi:FkbM family methyltransferase
MTLGPESFSQFGEDLVVWDFFERRTDGFFVEVGANDPVQFSQTWLLEKRGWTGLLVEPLAVRCARLRAARPRSRVHQVAAGAPAQRGQLELQVPEDDMFSSLRPRDKAPGGGKTELVTVTTLDDVLASEGRPALDFVSIDVEGLELEVLEGFALERHRPRLILMEDHFKSLAVHTHLVARGYELVKRTGCNNWYVPAGTPFRFTTWPERLRLWKRLRLNTPWNIARKRVRAALRGRSG